MNKILLITNDFLPDLGGIQSYLFDLVNCFNTNDIIIYSSSAHNYNEQKIFDKNFPYKIIRNSKKLLLPSLKVKKKINKIIKENNIKFIWFGASLPLGLMGKFIKKNFPEIKILCSTHGHEIWWNKFFKYFYRQMISSADYISYITDYTFSKLKKGLSNSQIKKFIKISPSINLKEHLTATIELLSGANESLTNSNNMQNITSFLSLDYILCISRLTQRKGQDTLIKCMPFINKKFPNIKLIIAGTGSYEKKLKRLANSNKNIIFTGSIKSNEKNKLLENCKIFAMPCRNRWFNMEVEGLGIVFLEASFHKKPIIVGDSGGAYETVINNKTGILTSTPLEVQKSIIKLLSNPLLCKEYGKNGYEFIKSQWTVNKRYNSLKYFISS